MTFYLANNTHIIEIKRAILINTTYTTGSQIIYEWPALLYNVSFTKTSALT